MARTSRSTKDNEEKEASFVDMLAKTSIGAFVFSKLWDSCSSELMGVYQILAAQYGFVRFNIINNEIPPFLSYIREYTIFKQPAKTLGRAFLRNDRDRLFSQDLGMMSSGGSNTYWFKYKGVLGRLKENLSTQHPDTATITLFTHDRNIAREFCVGTRIHYMQYLSSRIGSLRTRTNRDGDAIGCYIDYVEVDHRASLDEIPIHSKVREKINTHVEWVKSQWDSSPEDESTRSLCLYGEPGCGKTSIAYACAADINCVAIAANNTIDEVRVFRSFAGGVYPRSLVVFDDVDLYKCFRRRKAEMDNSAASIVASITRTTSETSLDLVQAYFTGPHMKKGIFNICTTNHPGDIDPSLLREGRMKECIEIPAVDDAGIRYWLLRNTSITEDVLSKTPKFVPIKANRIFSLRENHKDDMEFLTALSKERAPQTKIKQKG